MVGGKDRREENWEKRGAFSKVAPFEKQKSLHSFFSVGFKNCMSICSNRNPTFPSAPSLTFIHDLIHTVPMTSMKSSQNSHA